MSKGKGKGKSSGKGKSKGKDSSKSKGKSKGKGPKPGNPDKECFACGKKGHFARDCWSRTNQDRTVNEVDGAKAEPDTANEFVFAIENVVKDVILSQSGCEVSEDGLVMIDSGASVNVCPRWFGKSTLQKSDGSVRSKTTESVKSG